MLPASAIAADLGQLASLGVDVRLLSRVVAGDGPLGLDFLIDSFDALLLALDIGGLGSGGGRARLGFGPVVSLTVWLVLLVHALESRLVPQPGVRRVLALLGAAAVLLAWALPGEPQSLSGSPWAPLHWMLGVGAYGLFGAAVLHATMLDAADKRMRDGRAHV